MTAPEKFRLAKSLKDAQQNVIAKVIRVSKDDGFDRLLCEVCGVAIDMREARALRDWLTEVLP